MRPLVLLLLGMQVALGLAPAVVTIRNDFPNYYVPARLVLEGRAIDRVYERDWLQAEARREGIDGLASFVPQPPPNALLLVPLAWLEPPLAKAVWTLLLAAAYAGAFLLLRSNVDPWRTALVFLLPTAALWNAWLYGQPYPLLLLLICGALLALEQGRAALAGFLIAPVVVLKLYGLPFVLHFLWTRRWRAVAGASLGILAIGAVSVAVLGPAAHGTWLREVLPRSLSGEVQDPYATAWQSAAALAHRLFQAEPDLNPQPLVDAPWLARALCRAVPLTLVLLGALSCRPGADPIRLRREWAVLVLAALAASPLTSTYHFVLLVLPVAVLPPSWPVLAVLAFAASSAPLHLPAFPRLLCILALFAWALRPLSWRSAVVPAVAAGVLAAVSVPPVREQPWDRLAEGRGYVLGEPVECGDTLAWVTTRTDRLVVQTSRGETLPGPADSFAPSCEGGTLRARYAVEADDSHRRLSPDGRFEVYQAWTEGSFDLWVRETGTGRLRRVTWDPANELEPSWSADGRRILFATDRRRGLGFTSLGSIPFRP